MKWHVMTRNWTHFRTLQQTRLLFHCFQLIILTLRLKIHRNFLVWKLERKFQCVGSCELIYKIKYCRAFKFIFVVIIVILFPIWCLCFILAKAVLFFFFFFVFFIGLNHIYYHLPKKQDPLSGKMTNFQPHRWVRFCFSVRL